MKEACCCGGSSEHGRRKNSNHTASVIPPRPTSRPLAAELSGPSLPCLSFVPCNCLLLSFFPGLALPRLVSVLLVRTHPALSFSLSDRRCRHRRLCLWPAARKQTQIFSFISPAEKKDAGELPGSVKWEFPALPRITDIPDPSISRLRTPT